MSSESDGGEPSRGWTLVDSRGHAEDSEDSSGSSSDFVFLGEDSVQYHHVNRSSSAVDIAPDNSAGPCVSSSSLPANFRAHIAATASQLEGTENPVSHHDNGGASPSHLPSYLTNPLSEVKSFHSDVAATPYNHGKGLAGTEMVGAERVTDEQIQGERWTLPSHGIANNQSSDLENSVSSCGTDSTLAGSQSPLLGYSSGGLERLGSIHEGGNAPTEYPANFHPSLSSSKLDVETADPGDHLACNASDTVSVDSIEVLSMPLEEDNFLGGDEEVMRRYGDLMEGGLEGALGGIQDDSKLEAVPALVSTAAVASETEAVPHHSEGTHTGSVSDESDTSEFERIEPEMMPSVDEIGSQPNDDDEEGKMDVAGAIPTDQLEEETISNTTSVRPSTQPQNFMGVQSHDTEDVSNPFLQSINMSPPSSPNMSSPSTPCVSNVRSWQNQSASRIQPSLIHQLSTDGTGHHCRFSSSPPVGLQLQPPNRFGLLRQHRDSSSDEGFELVQGPVRQDDDATSTVSSSSSDLSGFVNVRQRRAPSLSHSVSRHHSDVDDMLDSISNFTDLSEECLPANMMVQSQKSGVRQYRHRRDEGLNTRLDWLVAMVLLAGLALGIGHFIGSTQEMAHQHSINTGQVQRLRELQDDLVTCLDRSSGIDSRVTTESSSPALQAVRLLEGLNSRMREDNLDASRLLEQKVGSDDKDMMKETDSGDAVLPPVEKEEASGGDQERSNVAVTSDEKKAAEDMLLDRQSDTFSSSDSHRDGDSQEELRVVKETRTEVAGLGSDKNIDVGELQTNKVLDSGAEQGQTEVSSASVVSDQAERELIEEDEIEDQGETAEKTFDDASPDLSEDQPLEVRVDDETLEDTEDASVGKELRDSEEDQPGRDDMGSDDGLGADELAGDSPKSANDDLPESSSANPSAAVVEDLQRKMALMEEKMNEVIKTAQHWQEMLEESRREEYPEEDQSKTDDTDHSSKSSDKNEGDGDSGRDKDPFAGIAATLENLWPGLLGTNQGKEFLQFLNQTQASFFPTGEDQNESVSWSEAFYMKVAALKALPDSDEAQAIMNNTKLFAAHLGKEIELVAGYLKNQSSKLAKENNLTVEGLNEKANHAWSRLKNVTNNVLDYNKMVLSSVGEQLTETLHSVENISAEIIAKQNLSVSSMGKMAEQVWGTVKNYSSVVTDSIVNTASEYTKSTQSEADGNSDTNSYQNTQSAFVDGTSDTKSDENERGFDGKASDTESDTGTPSGFGEKLLGAWDTVRSYSANFTSKQNLSISGLREQVKAAWGKVKNTSAQVLEDISESNFAERVTNGAKKLHEKVGNTFKSVKEKVKEKVKGFHKRKGHHGKKKYHQDHTPREEEEEKKHHKKKHKKHKHHHRNRKWKEEDDLHHKEGDQEQTFQKHHRHHSKHHKHHDRHHSSRESQSRSGRDGDKVGGEDIYSVPSRQQHQWYLQGHDESGADNMQVPPESSATPHSQQDQNHLYSAPPRPKWVLPTQDESKSVEEDGMNEDVAHHKLDEPYKQHQQKSVPSRHQKEQPTKPDESKCQDQESSDNGGRGLPKDKRGTPRDHLKEHNQRCPHPESFGSKVDDTDDTESNWEDLFDCIDMHCKGDEDCMLSQRRDAAKLYSELLDYQEWLSQRNLKKDVRELKEFLEELGEFLSETDSNDDDLDELKDEFGEMVQDMEDRALRRQRKQAKLQKSQGHKPADNTLDKDHRGRNQDSAAVEDNPEAVENSTVVIDFKTLPQQQDPKSDRPRFSSQSHNSMGGKERRKYAGRGFHSTGDDNDWYLQRAKDRAEQRESHDRSDGDMPNWYLHWVQGRINGRTGVTVWDMYEWIRERYMLREELRNHDMEDHTNWFLRRP